MAQLPVNVHATLTEDRNWVPSTNNQHTQALKIQLRGNWPALPCTYSHADTTQSQVDFKDHIYAGKCNVHKDRKRNIITFSSGNEIINGLSDDNI